APLLPARKIGRADVRRRSVPSRAAGAKAGHLSVGRLDGKVAFVTGGARGQGLEAAKLFAREGACVVLGDLLDAEGKEAASAGGGSIINISSVEGLRGSVGLAAYTASKFAVRGMTKVAAGEFGKYAIRVNSIHPGVIDTAMLRAQTGDIDLNAIFKRGVPLRRAGTPQDVANLALFLASDESSYCSGAEFVVDGGATSFVGWGGPVPRPD